MTEMTIVQAINSALSLEMARDKRVIILGEDVGVDGGVFRVTDGLWKRFGDERVISTPLAESAIIGTSIGLAINGMRPIAEIQFDGFTYPGLDQLISHASKYRNRSRGRFTVPMVLRFPYGGGVKALEHHSDSPETYYCHTPGLKVVIPSGPYDAKGLMISSIRDEDPVIFMEPKRMYRAVKEDVPDGDYTVPLGQAKIVSEGSDVTVLCWGAMVRECVNAIGEVGDVSVEIIDLRTLNPLDIDTIIKSVTKTGRAVVVHEAPKTCGFGAELVALINEKAFLNLEAPVHRVTGWDIPIPLPKLESNYFPNPKRIAKAINSVVSF